MVTLESASEPHLEPISRPETPEETQSAPASFKSIGLLSTYLDAGQPRAPRRSSEGDHPESASQVPIIPFIMDSKVSTSSDANPLLSAASSHATVGDDKTTAPGPTRNIPGAVVDSGPDSAKELDRYTSFPPGTSTDDLFRDSETETSATTEEPKKTSNQTTGQYLALQLQSADSVERALGTISEHSDDTDTMPNIQELLPTPETSLGISRLQFGSVVSFNTSVRDLIQETSDTPIGGKHTSPIERQAPVAVPKNPLASLTNSHKKPSLLNRYLNPQSFKSSSINSNGEVSETMVETPTNRRAHVATDLSYDGPAEDLPHTASGTTHIGTDARDFAFNPAQSSTLHECCVSPRSSIPNDTSGCVEPNALKTAAISALDGFFSEKRHPEGGLPPPASEENAKNSKGNMWEPTDPPKATTTWAVDLRSNREHALEGKENGFKKKEHHHKKENRHQKKADVDTGEGDGPKQKVRGHKKVSAREKSSRELIPIDNTNQASTPETPIASAANQPKAPLHRRIRGIVLVTPVLAIVIGRKLAKPTRRVLKQEAKTPSAAGGPVAD